MSGSLALPLAATPLISWSGLGLVALFGLAAGAVIVSAFSFALVGLDRWSASRSSAETVATAPGTAETARPADITRAATPAGVRRDQVAYGSLAMAIGGFAICVIAVVFGVVSMIVKA